MEVDGYYQASLIDLAAACGIVVEEDCVITGVQTELQAVSIGDIWCARKPSIEKCQFAVIEGAKAILCEVDPGIQGAVVLQVPDYEHATGVLLNYFYGEPSAHMQVAAVTGTNGKSTVAYLMTLAMRYLRKKSYLIGTLGRGEPGSLRPQRHTTPPASELHQVLAEAKERSIDFVAMEASSHGLDQGRLAGVMIDCAIFTNLTHEHLDYHKTIKAYLAAKEKLFTYKSVASAVINIDDPSGELIANRSEKATWVCSMRSVPRGKSRWSYGQISPSIHKNMKINILTHQSHVIIDTQLMGRFNAENLLVAHAALCFLGVESKQAARALSSIDVIPGRMQRVDFKELRCEVYIDYSHTPQALEQVLSEFKKRKKQRLWVVFGCGGERDRDKRPLMGEIAQRYCDEIVLTEDNSRSEDTLRIIQDIKSRMKISSHIHVIADRYKAIKYAIMEAWQDDIILIAGKGHENVMEKLGQKIAYSDIAAVESILSEQYVE